LSYGLQIEGSLASSTRIGLNLVANIDPLESIRSNTHFRGKKNINLHKSYNNLGYFVVSTEYGLLYTINNNILNFTCMDSSRSGILNDYRWIPKGRGIDINTKVYEVLDLTRNSNYGIKIDNTMVLDNNTLSYTYNIGRIYQNSRDYHDQPTYSGNAKQFNLLAVKKINQSFKVTGDKDFISWNNWNLELYYVNIIPNNITRQYSLKVDNKVADTNSFHLKDFIIFENDFYNITVENLDNYDDGYSETYDNSLEFSYTNGNIQCNKDWYIG
jgi:hypothetical protein